MSRSTRPRPARRASVLLGLGLLALALTTPAVAQGPEGPGGHGLPVPGLGVGGLGIPGIGVQQQILTTDVSDPTAIDIAGDGRLVIAERTGRIKIWAQDGTIAEAGRIPVGANSCDGCAGDLPEEGGLHGLLLAPDFLDTGHLYAYYSVPNSLGVDPSPPVHPDAAGPREAEGLWRLSRFTVDADGLLDLAGEVALLETPAYWSECCHYGGDLDWLPDGTIVLSTGDDTNPHEAGGYAPRDDGTGREAFNAERTAQNPADRRGKLLRLLPDGSVPDGGQADVAPNPHIDDPAYDPYVYAMGFRSPYRLAVDGASGAVIVGNVGPDAYLPAPERGPAGYDELEVVPAGGGTNHGWPRCIGDNEPYIDYDFVLGSSGDPLSCEAMAPAAVWYPYLASDVFPNLLAGLRTAMAGVVYDHDGDGALALPDVYRGRLLFSEWSRNLVFHLTVDGDGVPDGTSAALLHAGSLRAIDQVVGPDGAVYMAEYGAGFYGNADSQISRLTCLGCQPSSADYVGAPEVRGQRLLPLPGGDTASSADLPARGLVIGSVLLLGLGVPLRRRVT